MYIFSRYPILYFLLSTTFLFVMLAGFDNGNSANNFFLSQSYFDIAFGKFQIITPFTSNNYNGSDGNNNGFFGNDTSINKKDTSVPAVDSNHSSNLKDLLKDLSPDRITVNANTTSSILNKNTSTINSLDNNDYAVGIGHIGNNNTFETYHDSADGISIMFPTDWDKIVYPNGAMNYGIGHKIVVNFLGPLTLDSNSMTAKGQESESTKWRPYLSIEIYNQTDANKLLFQNGTMVEGNILGGHPAYVLVHSDKNNLYAGENTTDYRSVNVKIMQVWSTIKDKTYMFIYQAESSSFEKYLPVIREMLATFKTDF